VPHLIGCAACPTLTAYQSRHSCVNAAQRANYCFATTPSNTRHRAQVSGRVSRQKNQTSPRHPPPPPAPHHHATPLRIYAQTLRCVSNKPASKAGAAACWSPRQPLPLHPAALLNMTWPSPWRNCLRHSILDPAAAWPLMLQLQLLQRLEWRATLWCAMARAQMLRQ